MESTKPKKRGRPKKVVEDKQEQTEQAKFIITIQIGDTVISGKGATALEALQAIERPVKIIAKGLVTFDNGNSTKEIMLMPFNLKRLFYPTAQALLIKRFTFGMK